MEDGLKILALPLPKIAARRAYYAAFHSAEAFIFERTGKVAKTHGGVRSEFSRLLKQSGEADVTLTAFLAQAYRFKEISDYGKSNDLVTEAIARMTLADANRFVERIARLPAI